MSDEPPSPGGADLDAGPDPSTDLGPRQAGIVVEVDDEQADEPLDPARWAALAGRVLEAEGVPGPAEMGLRFVDRAVMAELNEAHLGHEGPTDVLAFPLDGDDDLAGRDAGPRLVGDVVVCPAVARSNAEAAGGGRTLDDEVALLVVHGVLHLLGHDHALPAEQHRMQSHERRHLAAIGVAHPVPAPEPEA